jgi:flagellin FlaB
MDEIKISKQRQNHKRGIVGVESAIVLIAFVIVAAALAFVVLNMGFASTQKAKETIGMSMEEAGVALSVEASISATGDITNGNIQNLSVPIRTSSGGRSVDLTNSTMSVRFVSTGPNTNVAYNNIYNGTLSLEYKTTSAAITAKGSSSTTSNAFVYWTQNINNNSVLDPGEHAVLVINLASADRPKALDEVTVEMLVPTGSVLTVSRLIPVVTTSVIDLQ